MTLAALYFIGIVLYFYSLRMHLGYDDKLVDKIKTWLVALLLSTLWPISLIIYLLEDN